MARSQEFLQLVRPRPMAGLVEKHRLSRRDREIFEDKGIEGFINFAGVGTGPALEPRIQRNTGRGEKVFTSTTTNATITIGPQRPAGLTSGYGGRGIPGSATIDLEAGTGGAYASQAVLANPNWRTTPARLSISQRADPDSNLDLPSSTDKEVKGFSALVGKADAIRLVSRGKGGIKLVAGLASDGRYGGKGGQKILEETGIELFGGGSTDMQPLVKGDNLVDALAAMQSQTGDLREIVNSFIKYQRNFNNKVITHNHNSPFYALTTAPSFNLIFDGIKAVFQMTAESEGSVISSIVNKAGDENNYLNPVSESYILSALNRTN
jgi:hypothetical protein